jgi:hypothetical protein
VPPVEVPPVVDFPPIAGVPDLPPVQVPPVVDVPPIAGVPDLPPVQVPPVVDVPPIAGVPDLPPIQVPPVVDAPPVASVPPAVGIPPVQAPPARTSAGIISLAQADVGSTGSALLAWVVGPLYSTPVHPSQGGSQPAVPVRAPSTPDVPSPVSPGLGGMSTAAGLLLAFGLAILAAGISVAAAVALRRARPVPVLIRPALLLGSIERPG